MLLKVKFNLSGKTVYTLLNTENFKAQLMGIAQKLVLGFQIQGLTNAYAGDIGVLLS